MTEPKSPLLASLHTNGFVANPMSSIAIATVCGMGFMFVTILLGAPILISMVGLFGGILLVYGYRVGKVTYDLYEDGIQMSIRRFIPYYLKKKEEQRFVAWKYIKSFKNDFDQQRGGGEYEFLKLYLSKSPGEIWITDQHDKSGFQAFRDAFKEVVRKEHEASTKTQLGEQQSEKVSVKTKPTHLIEKVGFYKTITAKVITILFILIAAGLVVLNQTQGLSFRNLFRLELVIIPGVAYMVYRVFVKVEE